MKPVNPASDNDDSQPDSSQSERSASNSTSRNNASLSSLESLQRRYTDQLSQDIEQLEAEKVKLQTEVAALRADYAQLHREMRSLRQSVHLLSPPAAQFTGDVSDVDADSSGDEAGEKAERELSDTVPASADSFPGEQSETTSLPKPPPFEIGPRLPGEKALPLTSAHARPKPKPIELPTPATSEQRRARVIQRQIEAEPIAKATTRRGLILSAIATVLTVIHYGLVGSLTQGGRWFGIEVGQLGLGFVPAVALLWLRMLVMVPVLVALAPELYRPTWKDLQDWFNTREQLFVPLIGSGVALFFSQVLLYQSIGLAGAVVGSTLLFLYPLSAVPLGLGFAREKLPTPLGLMALVAIAMGGFLIARPFLSQGESGPIWLGVLASLALSCYILLTNVSYRQQCHPVPSGLVQFSTVAVLSSLVLLIKPLEMADISWFSFCLWGILIGFLTLIAYLFTYTSLRTIGAKTAIVAAATPLVMLIIGWGFVPRPALEIIQWTGVFLVTLGGMALGKEKTTQKGN
ncbi:MAG: hypothetical protein AAFY54_09435 [Cyanobacteria bacterium J06648_10]